MRGHALFLRKWKQEAHGPHGSPEKQFQSINTFLQSYDYTITLIKRERKKALSPFWEFNVSYLQKNWNHFKFCHCIFAIFLLSPLGKGRGPSFDELEFPSPKNALCQVWLKLALLREDEYVKSLWQWRWQTTDKYRSEKLTCAFSSAELKYIDIKSFFSSTTRPLSTKQSILLWRKLNILQILIEHFFSINECFGVIINLCKCYVFIDLICFSGEQCCPWASCLQYVQVLSILPKNFVWKFWCLPKFN